jgi:hypothetical protein
VATGDDFGRLGTALGGFEITTTRVAARYLSHGFHLEITSSLSVFISPDSQAHKIITIF